MRKFWIWLLGVVVVLGSLFFLACEQRPKQLYPIDTKPASGGEQAMNPNPSGKAKTELSGPAEVLEKMLKTIEKGDLKGAEKYMTEDAIHSSVPYKNEKWVDYIASMLDPVYCKQWKINNCDISGSTAKVIFEYRQVLGYGNVKTSDRWISHTFIMEKENGQWYFDRILG